MENASKPDSSLFGLIALNRGNNWANVPRVEEGDTLTAILRDSKQRWYHSEGLGRCDKRQVAYETFPRRRLLAREYMRVSSWRNHVRHSHINWCYVEWKLKSYRDRGSRDMPEPPSGGGAAKEASTGINEQFRCNHLSAKSREHGCAVC